MAERQASRRARLSIDVEPDLRRKIKVAAAMRDLSVRDYVVAILRHAVEVEDHASMADERAAWSRLSTRSFTRDWESEEDQIYDRLS